MQELDLIAIIRLALKNWKTIAIWCGSFVLVGLVVTLTTPRVYKGTALLAPEQVVVSEEGDAIYPEIYPDIVGSTDFLLKLLTVEVRTKDGSVTTDYKDYLLNHTKHSLLYRRTQKDDETPITTVNLTSDSVANQPITLSRKEDALLEQLRESITCTWEKRTGVVSLNVIDQDPLVAAIIANHVTTQLQEAIYEYRTRKARIDLEYAQQIYNEDELAYKQAQAEYAAFTDAYGRATLESYRIRQQSLARTTDLHFQSFSNSRIKLQDAKMKLQENTPTFYPFQQASVSSKPAGRSRKLMMMLWLCLGLFCGVGFVMVRNYFQK